MNIIEVKDSEPREDPHGVDARALHESEHALVSHITLHPGEALKRHITPVDVMFYVLEGTGIVEVGEEKMEVGPDTLVDSPAKIPHCWFNESNETLRFLVVKAPRPTGPTKVLQYGPHREMPSPARPKRPERLPARGEAASSKLVYYAPPSQEKAVHKGCLLLSHPGQLISNAPAGLA